MKAIYFWLGLFVGSFLIVQLYYCIMRRRLRKSKKTGLATEVNLFLHFCCVDPKKVSGDKMLKDISLMNSLSIAIIVTLLNLIEQWWIKILLSICFVVVFILGTNYLLGYIYKKKGWTKNV